MAVDLETFDLDRAWTDFVTKAKLSENWPTLPVIEINNIMDEMNMSLYTSDHKFRLTATAPYHKAKDAVMRVWVSIGLAEKLVMQEVFYKFND